MNLIYKVFVKVRQDDQVFYVHVGHAVKMLDNIEVNLHGEISKTATLIISKEIPGPLIPEDIQSFEDSYEETIGNSKEAEINV